jgi:8-oxo-dGTP pyrophosphatase MutT (NUDIX family)
MGFGRLTVHLMKNLKFAICYNSRIDDTVYRRLVQTSVTCFLYHGDNYLFVKRSLNKRIDPGRLNGVGERLEPSENYLDAAIRETEEEIGYKASVENISLAGIVKLEGGYTEDWVMCFFKIEVPHMNIPIDVDLNEEGEPLWLHKDEILSGEYDLVDDLNYCMQDIINGKERFFITAQLDKNQKITTANVSKLPI